MANKKLKTSRLFQKALNDVIKSNAKKLERNSQWISTKEMIPLTVEPKHGIASKQKSSHVQLHASTSSLPCSRDSNEPSQKTSQPSTDCIADCQPVSLSISSSNCSLTSKNTNSVQDCSTSIYALPISFCEQGSSRTDTDCSYTKWVNPPSCNATTFSNGEKLYGNQTECDLFPKISSGSTCSDHLSEESSTWEWPLTNELCGLGSTIPAPKSVDDFFNSSSYIDQLNALNCVTVSPNPKSCTILSDSFPFGDYIDYQNGTTTIHSPKGCDSFPSSFSFTDVACSMNDKVSLPDPKDYDCLSNSSTFSNYEFSKNSEHSIPSPKSRNFFNGNPAAISSPKDCNNLPSSFADMTFSTNENVSLPSPKGNDYLSDSVSFSKQEYSQKSKHSIPCPKSQNFLNSFPFDDPLCLSYSAMAVSSPESCCSCDSSVPLTDKVCFANCDTIVSTKQFKNCSMELNSDINQNQSSTYRSNCSSLKCDRKAQYSIENIPKSCGFDNCDCHLHSCNIYTSGSKPSENLCQKLTSLSDCENKLKKHSPCDNLFPNDYIDELIKMGNNDSEVSRSEKDSLGDILKMDSKNFKDNLSKSVGKRTYENHLHAFDLENQYLKPSRYTSFENPSLVEFDEISSSRKSVVEFTDSSKFDFDYWMNQSNVCSTIAHSQSPLDQLGAKPNIKSDYFKSKSELGKTTSPIPCYFDLLSADSKDYRVNNLTASETKLIHNFKTSNCFEDKIDSVKSTNELLCYDIADEYSTSKFTSLDSLVDSNLENCTDIIMNTTDSMSVNSCISTSINSISELIASGKDYDSFASDAFLNESKSKSLLECNSLRGCSVGKHNFSSRPSTSIDSGIGFLLEDTISNMPLDRSSQPELNAFSFVPQEMSSKLVSFDKKVISGDCKAKYSATKFSEYEVDRTDFLVDDQQRIDNLIDQLIGL